MDDLMELKKIIAEAENIVFLGGAGVSTDSGIPDFRGNDGLYTDDYELAESPETILSTAYLYEHPRSFYEYYRGNMVHPYALPNDAHFALAELEKQGRLSVVITQNIDGLHQAAGNKRVLELHGTVHKNYCTRCGKIYDLSYIMDNYDVPYCEECGAIVRPNVVLYGEALDNEAFTQAQEAIYNADVLIVGGTSLTVHPAASLVDEFLGAHLIIINQTPTPYDAYAEYVIRDSISEVMVQLIDNE
jgi:NAD-dependent deacetylase